MSDSVIKLYFSFRSPYAWLACYRFSTIVTDLELEYELIPISPPKKIAEKVMPAPQKRAYVVQDVKRIATAYGLEYRSPRPFDCDWFVPHAAFLAAETAGKGLDFADRLFNSRFCEGKDISGEDVIVSDSKICGLDPDKILESVADKKNRRKLLEILSAVGEKGIFGVPTFIYGDNMYWGNDRIEWLIRDIYRDRGKVVPDLSNDLMARPF